LENLDSIGTFFMVTASSILVLLIELLRKFMLFYFLNIRSEV